MVSRASSQVMRSNLPSPYAPIRFIGYFRRWGDETNCMPVWPLAQRDVEPGTALLNASGLASTYTTRPSLTWHRTPQRRLAAPQPWQKVGIIFSSLVTLVSLIWLLLHCLLFLNA